MWWGKWGCRAASPLAAVAVCGGGKVPGRDKSLPYGLNHKRNLTVSCGPGMPGPYGLLFPVTGGGALGGAQRAPPASKAGPLVRLLAPQGQALLTTPVLLRSTVAPCSQPRSPRGAGSLRRNSETFLCYFLLVTKESKTSREAAAYCRACSAASSGGISCFLRLTTPGRRAMLPSGSTWNASRMISSALRP